MLIADTFKNVDFMIKMNLQYKDKQLFQAVLREASSLFKQLKIKKQQ